MRVSAETINQSKEVVYFIDQSEQRSYEAGNASSSSQSSKMEDGLGKTLSTSSFEQRFNCLICWGPKLRMVYGLCQHRLCESCLYDEEGKRRPGMERCPLCCKNSFPEQKPDIPEDNVEAQAQLGVRKCVYGCGLEMWCWELPDHMKDCPFRLPVTCPTPSKSTNKQKERVNTAKLLKSKKKSRTRSSRRKQTRTSTDEESWLRSGKRKRTK